MIGNLSAIMVENKASQKDISYWESQVETPRGPVTEFQSATLESLAKERLEKKKQGVLKDNRRRKKIGDTTELNQRKISSVASYFTHAEIKVNNTLHKWGDGDGSYFERWLAVTPPTKTHRSRGAIIPTQGYKAQILKEKEKELDRRRKRLPHETPEEKKKFAALEADFDGMFYNSSDSDDEEEEDIHDLEESLRSPINKKNTIVLDAREKTRRKHHDQDFQLSPRSKKYIGSPAKYRMFQKYHKEAKTILKLPPLNLSASNVQKHTSISNNNVNHNNNSNNDTGTDNETDNQAIDDNGNQDTVVNGLSDTKNSKQNLNPKIEVSTHSARRNYLAECVKHNLPPMSNLMIRKIKSKELNISNYGIGDRLGNALAHGLMDMPNIEILDLSDNRFTGKSLSNTLIAAAKITTLVELNIGSNKLGVAGMNSLMYLLKNSQTLESLGLGDCKCTDREAVILAAALSENESLQEVDLHGNRFNIEAGIAFGKMLDQRTSKSKIVDLDLSWTEIRKEGAIAVARAIKHNTTLEKLDLSYCAFGDYGTMEMMESLRTNDTMNWLEMDNNAIKGKGSLVIANSLEDNKTLTYLQLWENPLGKSGGRAMLRCVARTGDVRNIDLESCNFEIEEDGLFDPADLPDKLDLNLSDLYQRAVASEFFRSISEKPGVKVKKITIDGQPVQFEQLEPDELPGYKSEDEFDSDRSDSDSDSDSEVENNDKPPAPYKKPVVEDPDAKLLFKVGGSRYVVPNEGQLIVNSEVEKRKPKKSQKISKDGVKGIMAIVFDSESATRRDRFLRLERASEDAYLDTKQLKKILKKIKDGDERKDVMDILMPRLLDPENKLDLLTSILGSTHIDKLEDQMGCLFHFTPQNPTGHYELNLEISNDRKLMTQMLEINNDDKRWAMERSARGDTSRDGDWENFRNATYKNKPIKLTGDYIIPMDGILEFDYVHVKTPSRKARGLVPTSSKFKRIMKNLGLTPGCDFKEKPAINPGSILSFFRPKYNLSQMEGKKLRKCAASRLQFWYRKILKARREWEKSQPKELTQEEKEEVAIMRLQGWYRRLVYKWYEREQDEKVERAEARLFDRAEDLKAGRDIERLEEPYCLVLDFILTKFDLNTEVYQQCDALMARALYTDNTKVDMDMEEAADELEKILEGKECGGAIQILRKLQEAEKEELARQAAIEEANRPKQAKGFGGAMGGMLLQLKARHNAEQKARVKQIMSNGVYPLRRQVSKIYVTCEQVAYILRCFPGGEQLGKDDDEMFCKWLHKFDEKEMGSNEDLPLFCRVTVLQSCFSRIVDLENIWTTILLNRTILSHQDYEVAILRLGWLNVWNPMCDIGPDLIYDLDMSIKEHYTLTLQLIELADVEPGENFLDETWTKWDRQAKTEYVPGEKGDYVEVAGWELPMSWVENGPPDMGFLHVYYYSGRDEETGKLIGKWGCAPVWDLRKKMLKVCLAGNKK